MPLSSLISLLVLKTSVLFIGSEASELYHPTGKLIETFRRQTAICPHTHTQWLSVKPTILSLFMRHPPPDRLLMITVSRQNKFKASTYHSSGAKIRRPVIIAVFGEHPRERITTELALEVLKRYCHSPPLWIDFVLIPIANLQTRYKVDSGASCERLNHRSVDLNRNYAYRWGQSDTNTVLEEEAPGARPFSEFETSAIDMLVQRLRPVAYVSVHSGDSAVLVPWDSGEPVGGWVYQVADSVRKKHCSTCRVGSSETVFGYRAYGTGVDHMFGVRKVPFACTLEVYGGPKDDCSSIFNPATQSAFADVLRNWSGVLDTIGKEVKGVDPESFPWYDSLIPKGYKANIFDDGEVDTAERSAAGVSALLFVALVSFVVIILREGILRLWRHEFEERRRFKWSRRLLRGRSSGSRATSAV